MIKVQQLKKEFILSKKQQKEFATNDKIALAVNDVSFECQPGRIYSLLGPNGAGKTTTLRMLATIFKPTSGQIEIAGIDAIKYPEEARKKIGFLTGSAGLYGRLTPNELVKYFADLYNVSSVDFQKRKNKLFDLLDMHEFANKRIAKLSTGMKQKVSIVRTMIHDPEVIIFDEPTSGLDVITSENIIRLIQNSKEEGKTVIFSSHIMSEVDLLSDDIGIVHKGKLLFNDTKENFIAQKKEESLTAEFIRIIKEA
jgi:sodium transport system ATP-binding protein